MVDRRIKAARFPATKSLDTFDFLAMPSVNKHLVMQLARCEYADRRENVIAVSYLIRPKPALRNRKPIQLATNYALGEPVVVLSYPDNLIEKVLVATRGIIGADARWGSRATGTNYLILDAVAGPG